MATKYYIKGLGFIEDIPANRTLLISKGRIQEEPEKVIKTKKKKKDDTVDSEHGESDNSDVDRVEE